MSRVRRSSRPPAADQAEGAVQPRYRGAARQQPHRPAQGKEAPERDDEGGDADIGDDEALEATDEGTETEPQREGDDPLERAVQPESDRRQPLGLEQRIDHRHDADDGPDRQVDVPRHDDQDHAGRHDGRARCLDRERHHVRRPQERPAGHDVEAEEDAPPARATCRTGAGRSPSLRASRPRIPAGRAVPDRAREPRRLRQPFGVASPCDGSALARGLGRGPGHQSMGPLSRLLAGRWRGGRVDALAQLVLREPSGVDDQVQVLLA